MLTIGNVTSANYKSFEKIIVFGDGKPLDGPNVINYNEIDATDGDVFGCGEPQTIDKNIALILCSPQTNDLPAKGIQLSQRNIMFAVAQFK